MTFRIVLMLTLSLSLISGCSEMPVGQPTEGESAVAEEPSSEPTGEATSADGAPRVEEVPRVVDVVDEPAPLAVYTAPPRFTAEAAVEQLKVLDIDGDGVDELVFCAGETLTLWSVEDGGLSPSGMSFTSEVTVSALFVGDFDGDGAGEFLIESDLSWQIVEPQDGVLTVTHSLARDPAMPLKARTAVDADADGRTDLVLLNPACHLVPEGTNASTCPNHHYQLLWAGGRDGMTELSQKASYENRKTHRLFADVDGDGGGEVVSLASWGDDLFNPGHTTITVSPLDPEVSEDDTSMTVQNAMLRFPWTGDIDGDGALEFLAESIWSDSVMVFKYADGALTKQMDVQQMEHFHTVDLGGDSDAELIVGTTIISAYPNARLNAVISPSVTPSTVLGGAHVTFMDINLDGLKDVVTATAEGRVQVLFADGEGGLQGWQTHGSEAWLGQVKAADLGSDGRPDLIGTRADGNGATLLVNSPQVGLVGADFPTGGYQDFVMDCIDSTRPGGLLCAGSSVFGFELAEHDKVDRGVLLPPFFNACGADAWEAPIPHLTAGDFNGDGLEDVVVSMQQITVRPQFFTFPSDYWDSEGTLLVFAGTPDGGFTFDQMFQRAHISTDVTAFDIDADGRDELLVIDSDGALESWGPVDGVWSMLDVTQCPQGLLGLQVVSTHQGPLLLARTKETQEVLTFRSSEDGVLVAHGTIDFDGDVVSMALADLDGDGDDDLVVATQDQDALWACTQTTDGLSEPTALLEAGLTPASIDLADFDLDGCPDIAASFKGVKGIVIIDGQCAVAE